jgi:hypothetical protein
MIYRNMFDALCHLIVNGIDLGKMTGMERFGNRYPLAILDAHETKDGQYIVFTAQGSRVYLLDPPPFPYFPSTS